MANNYICIKVSPNWVFKSDDKEVTTEGVFWEGESYWSIILDNLPNANWSFLRTARDERHFVLLKAAEIKSDESGKLCLTDPVILKQESQVITASEAQEINSLGAKSQQQTEFVQKITKKHEKLYDDKLKFLYDLKQRNMWQDGLSAPQGYGTDEVLCDEGLRRWLYLKGMITKTIENHNSYIMEAQTEENFLARRKLLLKFILNSQKTPTSISGGWMANATS